MSDEKTIKELQCEIVELKAAIVEKDKMNAKHLEVNNKLAGDITRQNQIILNLEGDVKNYEKIFAKKDKQVDKQFAFIQEYRAGLIRLGTAYRDKKICDNGAIDELIKKIDGLTKVYNELKASDKKVLEAVREAKNVK